MTYAAEVLRILDEGPSTAHEISAELGHTKKRLVGILCSLKKRGRVHVIGRMREGKRGPLCCIWALAEPKA